MIRLLTLSMDLVELVKKTYYPHADINDKDTLILFKIIFPQHDEAFLRKALGTVKEDPEPENPIEKDEPLTPAENLVQEAPFKEQKAPLIPEKSTILESLVSRQLTGDQRSSEWLMQRVNYITASVSAACAGLMGASSREAQLLEKASNGAYRSFKGGYHTDIGNIFEDITASHYSRLNNTRVHDFRLIPHYDPEFSFLGASTDGVSEELNNIEIKTLAGRPLDSKIKKEYYHQMQQQMSCLGLAQTHFLEAKYETFDTLTAAARGTQRCDYGIALEFFHPEEKFNYIYSPDDSDLPAWESAQVHLTEPGVYIRTIYWRRTGYQMKVVPRDPDWLKVMGPALKGFWEELQELRKDPAKVQKMIADRESKPRGKASMKLSLTECMI